MSEENCLIVKYLGYYGKDIDNNDDDFEAENGCNIGSAETDMVYVLNEIYTKKFELNPIKEISIYLTDVEWKIHGLHKSGIVMGKLYFQKKITKEQYNTIKELKLSNEEEDLIKYL
jgi:hypothetical protein